MIIKINEIIELHGKWLRDEEGGVRADFHDMDFRGADLRGIELIGADLSDVNLSGADLKGADLYEAELSGANFRGADLRDVEFSGADLRDADLSGADLRGANLRGTDLRGADLRGTGMKLFQAGKWTAIVMRGVISVGCQRHATESWRAFRDDQIARMHEDALQWWRENKAIVMTIAENLEAKN